MLSVARLLQPSQPRTRSRLLWNESSEFCLLSGLTPWDDLCYPVDSAINNPITKNAPTLGGGPFVATKQLTWWRANAMNRSKLFITYRYFTPDEHENATDPIHHRVGFSRLRTLTSFILALVAYKATSLSMFCSGSVRLLRGVLTNHRHVQASMYPILGWDDPCWQPESIPFLTFVSIPHRCLNRLHAATIRARWVVWRARTHH